MTIGTQTQTFTNADIYRVADSFAADFAMKAQATGLWSRENVARTVADLKAFAAARYLLAIHLILWDAAGKKLRAAKYTVSTTAAGWVNQQPGNNLWPQTPGGRLQVIGTLSDDWWALDETQKAAVRERWGIASSWGRTDTDTSHRDMIEEVDLRFASNGYGWERASYR